MKSEFDSGYYSAITNMAAAYGARQSEKYIGDISNAINQLENSLNRFKGYATSDGQLQGDIAEYWHGETYNINAALNSSPFRATVDRSHDFASPDIKTDWGEEYGLKYYKNAAASAKAQSTNYFERFAQYRANSGNPNLTVEEYIKIKRLPEDIFLNDPIYSGQARIIPTDQLEAAKEYLRNKIAKESLTRPEQVKRYQETLDYLTDKIKSPDGISSVELTREQSEELARLAKAGDFNAESYGFSTEELVKIGHILNKGIEAGLSAAIVSLVLRIGPEIYKCIEAIIEQGRLDEDAFRRIGFAALEGSGEGFLRGFISASLTTTCEAGLLGSGLKNIDPNLVAALTVILVNTMKDSFLVVKGTMTKNELASNLSRNVFVTACGLGGGALVQAMAPMIPFAYLLGNFVGSFIGSFAYVSYEKAFLSFCVNSGWTMFGLVDQNYELPDELIKLLGFDVFEISEYNPDTYTYDEFSIDEYQFDQYTPDMVRVLQRGVVGVWQIGYRY